MRAYGVRFADFAQTVVRRRRQRNIIRPRRKLRFYFAEHRDAFGSYREIGYIFPGSISGKSVESRRRIGANHGHRFSFDLTFVNLRKVSQRLPVFPEYRQIFIYRQKNRSGQSFFRQRGRAFLFRYLQNDRRLSVKTVGSERRRVVFRRRRRRFDGQGKSQSANGGNQYKNDFSHFSNPR